MGHGHVPDVSGFSWDIAKEAQKSPSWTHDGLAVLLRIPHKAALLSPTRYCCCEGALLRDGEQPGRQTQCVWTQVLGLVQAARGCGSARIRDPVSMTCPRHCHLQRFPWQSRHCVPKSTLRSCDVTR